MSIILKVTLCTINLLPAVLLSGCQPSNNTNPGIIPSVVVITPHGYEQGASQDTDIAAIINLASARTQIQITEGVYLVDNPIILRSEGVTIKGAGPDKTVLTAKNPYLPIFQIQADLITIEALTINALVDKGPSRASFAIQIAEGVRQCNIIRTNIIDAAASAIIGHAASDCTVLNNTIVNSGDDAVRLRGDRLTIVDNTIIRYFDEALDLAVGQNIVVTGNYASSGRIGIVVADSKNAIISMNIVENQILEGIVSGADPENTISANHVRNAGYTAYNLYAPHVVASNIASGENEIWVFNTRYRQWCSPEEYSHW